MAEPVEWEPDGTPRSPRFGDIYRSCSGGLEQARHVFLRGCGLPAAWAGQRQWRILETGFGLGLNFLAAWQAWRADPQRPRMLHFVSVEAWPVSAADLLRSAGAHEDIAPLAQELAAQWFGLTPGAHRMSFENGRVLLTLHVRDARDMLRHEPFTADSVFLDGFDPRRNPQMWDEPLLKAVARHCRRGARIATWTVSGEVRRALAQCGFELELIGGLRPKRHCLAGRFDPAWEPKGAPAQGDTSPGEAIVVGAGLAGAAAAASLARRGWRVTVLDAAAQPAAGASGLPAGLLAPHHSPDDNILSRLSRCGVRQTLQQARSLLVEGQDFGGTGVLEHSVDGAVRLASGDAHAAWTRTAEPAQIAAAGLVADATAVWHKHAAWIRPASLVRAWLSQAGVTFQGGVKVERIVRCGDDWSVEGSAAEIARAPVVVIAAALGSGPLAGLALNPVRGQVSFGPQPDGAAFPAFPVNGHGHFIPSVGTAERPYWYCGSTYGRADADAAPRPADQLANLDRLRVLVPAVAAQLEPTFANGTALAWSGVRCTSPDRRPLVGELDRGLFISTAMGSRGLSFCTMAAELLAAQLAGEPLPMDRRLAEALDPARTGRRGLIRKTASNPAKPA